MESLTGTRILEVTQVAPATVADSRKSKAAELSLPLTFLDTRYLKFPPAERIYYFKLTGTSAHFHSQILPTLKHSLSRTLLRFLPLAGHLTWPPHSPKPIIHYSPNDTVSVYVVESNADFDRLAGDEIRQASDSRVCIPELSASDTKASIIALQITYFPYKGFSIAIAMHHAALDGTSASMFLKSWARICKNTADVESAILSTPELTPSFDRAVIKDRDGLESFYLNHWLTRSNSESNNPRSLKLLQNFVAVDQKLLVRATFHLSKENINNLRKRVSNYYQDAELQLSKFVLVSSYVSVCLVKARGGDYNRKVYFLVTADCRSRMSDPPVPQNYFGNCVFVQDLILEAGDFMEENGIAIIAKKVSGFIKGLEKGIFKGAKEFHERIRSDGAEVQRFSVSGSPRFKYYGEDFGWGRPKKVEIASIDRIGAISLIESRNGNGGIEIGLSMVRQEMEAFASFFSQCLQKLLSNHMGVLDTGRAMWEPEGAMIP